MGFCAASADAIDEVLFVSLPQLSALSARWSHHAIRSLQPTCMASSGLRWGPGRPCALLAPRALNVIARHKPPSDAAPQASPPFLRRCAPGDPRGSRETWTRELLGGSTLGHFIGSPAGGPLLVWSPSGCRSAGCWGVAQTPATRSPGNPWQNRRSRLRRKCVARASFGEEADFESPKFARGSQNRLPRSNSRALHKCSYQSMPRAPILPRFSLRPCCRCLGRSQATPRMKSC